MVADTLTVEPALYLCEIKTLGGAAYLPSLVVDNY